MNAPNGGLDDQGEISGDTLQRFGTSFHRDRFHREIDRSVGDRCLSAERDPGDQIETD